MPKRFSRRTFLITGAALGGTALVAAVAGVGVLANVDMDGPDGFIDGDRAVFNAFVAIHDDGRVVVQVPRSEMGQGIHSGLAMVAAEELDIPFDDRITVEHPTELLPVYASLAMLDMRPEEASGPVAWGLQRILGLLPAITTGASSSTMGLWYPMRLAGATARGMLVAAAATRLEVPASELSTADATVRHEASGRVLSYAELARDAALLPPPAEPALKPPSAWRIIGTFQPRLDLPAKVRGEPVFGVDVVLPDMLHASIRHAPVFGAEVTRVTNEGEIRSLPGVVDVIVINRQSVAVVADSWWRAEVAARQLQVAWTSTDADSVSSATIAEGLEAALDGGSGHTHVALGDVVQTFSDPNATLVAAAYDSPFMAHGCMEPMAATVVVRSDGSAEAWASSQSPLIMRTGVQNGVGQAGGNVSSVTSHVTMNGGGFGRRTEQDVVAQAAFLAARHLDRPIKLMWSREEDISRGVFRTTASARLRAAIGPDGLPTAYDAVVAAPSAGASFRERNTPLPGSADGDDLTVEGVMKSYYAFPGSRIRSHHVPTHVPLGLWRSNGYSFGTFFAESFIDECALVTGADPLAYRQALLRNSPRHLAVLNHVAEMANWGAPLGPGRGRGIAIEEAFESVVAQVVEVSVAPDGEITVDRIYCACDVGTVINPDGVIAQMEGSIIYALTTALGNTITIENGAVVESNFHDFPMLRIADAPDIIVEIVPSELPPGGVGEPGVAPVAGALGNAIFDASGRRLRSLPLAITETTGERQTRRILPSA